MKKLNVIVSRCPQNHPCPSVRVCPVGALSQKGYSAPTVDDKKCICCGKCSKFCPKKESTGTRNDLRVDYVYGNSNISRHKPLRF